MPITHTDTTPAPAFTIARARLVGQTPREAHEAVLAALDAGIIAVSDAAGAADPATIDAKVAELADARKVCVAHAPVEFSKDPTTPAFCAACVDGPLTDDQDQFAWPCAPYRAAAGIIADGLPR